MLALAALGCSGSASNSREPASGASSAEQSEQHCTPAPIETPNADSGTSTREPAKLAFATCEDQSAVCPAGTACVDAARDPSLSCVPIVRQEDLDEPSSWNHPVLIENPRIASYARKQTCKSTPCGWSGAMLPLDGERFIALELEKGDVWRTNGGVHCSPHAEIAEPGCPDYPTARVLGVVHAHHVPGQTGALLTFELIGAEPKP